MALLRRKRSKGTAAPPPGSTAVMERLASCALAGDVAAVTSGLDSTNDLMARVFAAKLLPKMVDPPESPAAKRATDALVGALDDVNPGVRCAAAKSLGEIGDPRAIAPLVHHMNDPDMSEDVGVALALIAQRSKPSDELAAASTSRCPNNATGAHEWYSALSGDEMCALCGERISKGKELRCPYCSEMTPAIDWPSYGDTSAFFNQTRERTEEEPGEHRIEATCTRCSEAFFVVWDRDPRPPDMRTSRPERETTEKAPSTALNAVPMPPNDALRALRSTVEQLAVAHPRREHAILDPNLDKQLPWISRTLDEAAGALESGIDPRGLRITNKQIANGLRKLQEMVRHPEYLTAMELGHPGIAKPLEQYMDQLDRIVGSIEGPSSMVARATELYSSSKGVATLIDLCNERGILFGDYRIKFDAYEMYRQAIHSPDYEVRGAADAMSFLRRAVDELRREGGSGSSALAVLVRELLRCRSPEMIYALVVVADVDPTADLLDALDAVSRSSERTEAPTEALFAPGMAGEGRIGWTNHTQVVGMALKARAALENRG